MPRPISPDALAAQLDTHLAKVARRRARRGLPAPQVRVEAPGFSYRSGDELPFHAASVGKLATAALVAQQISADHLAFTTSVDEVLPPEETAGLFARSGATVEQLLGHTTGVADYFGDPVTRGTRFVPQVLAWPDRFWNPAELLAFSRELQRPVEAPGERFHYSDTGYVLLGRILEQVTGQPFDQLVRTRILDPLGMTGSASWLRESGPERIAPLWLGGVEASGYRSISCDWAGGGIVSTLDDLARLGGALTDGTLIDTELWARLAQPRERFRAGIHYGLGVMQLRFEGFMPLLRGLPRPVGHLGVLGTHLFVDPDRGTSVALNFHDTREMVASFQTHIRIAQGLARLG